MLSEDLRNTLQDFIEEAERQEKYAQALEDYIQAIVNKCKLIFRSEPMTEVGRATISEIIEEYKECI